MNPLDAFERLYPRVHRNDPKSSHEAAAEGEKSGRFARHLDQVLDLVKRFPNSTAAELAKVAKSKHLDKHEIRRRLTELVDAGLVDQSHPTPAMAPCAVAGKRACRYNAR